MSLQDWNNIAANSPGKGIDCLQDLIGEQVAVDLAEFVDLCVDEGLEPSTVADIIADPANADVQAAIKDVVEACLADPAADPAFTEALDKYILTMLQDATRNPITKDMLAEIIQGQDINGNGVVG